MGLAWSDPDGFTRYNARSFELFLRALKLLAIETSTPWCSVAVLVDGQMHAREVLAEQRHSELLLPMVDGLMRELKLHPRELDGVAFGSGPGSFTGVRIACGVAQGIAIGANLRLAPIVTLMALAEAAGHDRVLSCLDARMGELYIAAYQRADQGWTTVIEPVLCKPDVAPALAGEGWVGAGSGFVAYGTALRARYACALLRCDDSLIPHAREIATLAHDVFRAGSSVAPMDAAPLYIRNRIALTTAERAQGVKL